METQNLSAEPDMWEPNPYMWKPDHDNATIMIIVNLLLDTGAISQLGLKPCETNILEGTVISINSNSCLQNCSQI